MKPLMYDKYNALAIKMMRHVKKCKQINLCQLVGVSESTLSKIENGQMAFTTGRMVALADELNVPVTEILALTEFISGFNARAEDLATIDRAYEAALKRKNLVSVFTGDERKALVKAIKLFYRRF